MSVEQMKAFQFSKATYDDWEKAAEKALKGVPLQQLFTQTIEGIELQPLYTKEKVIEKLGDQLELQANIIKQSKTSSDWKVAQETFAASDKEYLALLKDSLSKGNEVVFYNGLNKIEWSNEALEEFASIIIQYPILFTNMLNSEASKVFSKVEEKDREKVNGIVHHIALSLVKDFPNVRTHVADMTIEHYDGATAVHELGIALAAAAEQARQFGRFEDFTEKFAVIFAVDTNFFMEIAKLRAFRVLWHAFTSAYEVNSAPPPIITETSLRSFSKLDPYVNLLRAGNEAFSAAIGGADMIIVHPHNVLTKVDHTSVRIARNIQLILKEETHIQKTVDAVAGSYYIEALTNELVEKGWEYFLKIEDKGGLFEAFADGFYLKDMEQMSLQRVEEVAIRKHSLIGTNKYANPKDIIEVTPITSYYPQVVSRIAESFELTREQFQNSKPKTALLTFGSLKEFKSRADFVSGFLHVGGIDPIWSPSFQSVNEAVNYIKGESIQYVIVCATDDVTVDVIPQLLQEVGHDIIIDVAGKYDENLLKQWQLDGLNGNIYNGQHILNKLQSIATRLKGVTSK